MQTKNTVLQSPWFEKLRALITVGIGRLDKHI